ncbi:acid protease [Cylindrobasidium torrendii FP15055 ss-10]|uniref:Acid protease n=1 Tax=Cylindrobasidium torrendii FP15055 ss-10 TaxID=1314674 RepID=A0A0D7AXZ0_9AGAR|nr:acid protease [Cylindrobasidium torrendii FP15055 ss-10]
MKLSLLVVSAAISFAAANPVNKGPGPVKVPLSKRFSFRADGKTKLPDVDRARASALRQGGGSRQNLLRRDGDETVQNVATVYTASIGIGEPATQYTLLIDTGSSNTWIGANQTYKETDTSKDTGDTVSVSYGSGSFSGKEYTDKVTISDGLVIDSQSIGVADESQGLTGFDGILGIGPVALTEGTLSDSSKTIPTVTDNLADAGSIKKNAIGIFYAPASEDDTAGTLTWGGADSSLYTGDLNYVPITSTSPASAYWGVDQDVAYGGSSILDSSAGIVDTGTTLVLLATDAFDAYKKQTGAKEDSATGLLKITKSQYSKLSDLTFTIGGTDYTLSPNAQIWPRSLNADIGGDANSIYLIVADLGSQSGQGLDFINGYSFLERFYTVYDTENSQVGFAETKYTDSTAN